MMFGWRPTPVYDSDSFVTPSDLKNTTTMIPVRLKYAPVLNPSFEIVPHGEQNKPVLDFDSKIIFQGFRPPTSFQMHEVFNSNVEFP